MGCVDKTVVVAEVVSSSPSRSSVELRSVDMAVTSVSRCVVVVMLLLLLLLLLLFPSHSMFWAAAVATVVQLSTSSSRVFFATHPSSGPIAFFFIDLAIVLFEYSFSIFMSTTQAQMGFLEDLLVMTRNINANTKSR